MEHEIEEYTVGELARQSGISVRMLHHYDAIGLLKPAYVQPNGYRIYRMAEALRLQEILFYRATGMQLGQIAELLDKGKPLKRLIKHRETLVQNLSNQAEIIATIDRTIAHLKGEKPMPIENLYKPFSEDKQTEYENWLVGTYGQEMAAAIAKSRERLDKANTDEKIQVQNQKLKRIEAELVAAYEAGIKPHEADLDAHQQWISEMWGNTCDADAYAKLSELYLAHSDFIARYETLSEGFSQWLPAAMTAWSRR